eukprot:1157141-Pelagomonas_calceolata.AAC.4
MTGADTAFGCKKAASHVDETSFGNLIAASVYANALCCLCSTQTSTRECSASWTATTTTKWMPVTVCPEAQNQAHEKTAKTLGMRRLRGCHDTTKGVVRFDPPKV